MVTTVRVHMNHRESCFSLKHNRNKDFRKHEDHIDGNSDRFEVWKDVGVYNAYGEVFGNAIRAYNKKQKRKDRKIVDENGDEIGGYIQSIQTSRRGKKERVVYKNMPDGSKETVGKRQESQGQRLLYEIVCSAGNCEKERDDDGKIIYDEDGHEIHPYRLPYEVNRAACKELSDRFEELYPHFKMVCSSWHGDEFYLNANGVAEPGIEHVHINFIPVATGYKRGLSKQASISKALEQMGFVNAVDDNGVWHNAYYYWTQDVQQKFEDILREKFTEYQAEKKKSFPKFSILAYALYSEELTFKHPAKGKSLPNLDPERYRELKDVERQLNVANDELNVVQGELEQAEKTIADAKEKEENLDDYIAAKMQEADQYYAERKEEAAGLIREAMEKHKQKVEEAELRFGDIVNALKKISEDLEFCKKRCLELLNKKLPINISDKMVEYWLRKNKIVRNNKWVSAYDACSDDISRKVRTKAEAQYNQADTLSVEVRKQMEIAAEYMEEFESDKDETNTEYGLVV